MNAADEISQAERRRIMADERRMKSYHGHALDDEPELSGRFAKVSTTTVVGRGPVNYPAQPEGSPWRSDPVPPEMPLGIDINAQEPTGEKHEVEASTVAASAVEDGSAVPVKPMHRMDTVEVRAAATVTSHPVVAAGFRRRF